MLHGATVPGWEFDRLAPYLHAAGFQTVCPDLYGHGYSARPDRKYIHDLFVQQALELVAALELAPPIRIVGHSLGAAIGTRIACLEPGMIDKLVLIAPLLDFTAVKPRARLLAVPGIGELLMPAWIVPGLKRRRRRRYREIDDGRFVKMFNDQLRIPGFGKALLSLIRSGSLGDQSAIYCQLANLDIPALILRGSADSIFTAGQFAALQKVLPAAEFEEFPGMEHPLMLTHPAEVARRIVQFL